MLNSAWCVQAACRQRAGFLTAVRNVSGLLRLPQQILSRMLSDDDHADWLAAAWFLRSVPCTGADNNLYWMNHGVLASAADQNGNKRQPSARIVMQSHWRNGTAEIKLKRGVEENALSSVQIPRLHVLPRCYFNPAPRHLPKLRCRGTRGRDALRVEEARLDARQHEADHEYWLASLSRNETTTTAH
ncbi:hypothetical protein BV25DRAFT_1823184 [Artomyces pyxidatus]|uniref:Uncharacterized protein n=1 Tax=Artomyces pyxidatus TaxID=48021 RepID=A0ACB8T7I5_9AGAM|nr:hypothetical protein BV25DRAFT_1823184 [Artomyces pyxidatus]